MKRPASWAPPGRERYPTTSKADAVRHSKLASWTSGMGQRATASEIHRDPLKGASTQPNQ